MAITINDTRTEWDDADSATAWNRGTANTTDYAEANAAITDAIDNTSGHIEATKTSVDMTNTMIYVWSANIAEQNTWKPATLSTSPHCLRISDGTNALCLLNAGNDREVFKHQETQVVFQCLMIDTAELGTKNTAGEIYVQSGTYAGFDVTAVTEIGAYYTTNAKAFKGWNCGCDIIRYGANLTKGLEIYGGTSSVGSTFAEIASEDRSKTTAKHYGVMREYAPKTFGCQGNLFFGTTTATGNAYFDDDGIVLVFENRDVDKFTFKIQGNTTDTNSFVLKNSRIGTAGPGLIFNVGANVDTLEFDGVAFDSVLSQMTWPTDSASHTHTVKNCTFNNCTIINPQTVDFTDNTITNQSNANGALTITGTTDTSGWSGNTVVSPGSGHAILILATGTYTLTDHTFIGYANQTGTEANRIIYNLTSGTVTINNDGSGELSYRNGPSATTVIVDTATITYTGIANGTEIRVYNAGTTTEKSGVESVTGGQFAASLEANTSYDVVAIAEGYVPIRLESQSYAATQSVNLNQQIDRNFGNA